MSEPTRDEADPVAEPRSELSALAARVSAVIDTLSADDTPAPLPLPALETILDQGLEPAAADGDKSADSLADVLGIGPALAHRIATLGITSASQLCGMNTEALAKKLGPLVDEDTVADWVLKAKDHV